MPSDSETLDDVFEVLDPMDKDWVQRYFGELAKASAPKQIAVGGLMGYGTGYVFAKVSRATAATLGGGLLLLQIGAYQGYITVNRSKAKKEVEKARKKLNKALGRNYHFFDHVIDFAKENAVLACSFGAGFLIGVSF